MAKKIKMKPNVNVGMVNEIEDDNLDLIMKGERVSEMLMTMMQLVGTDLVGIGALAVGLSRAMTALKVIARRLGVPVDDLCNNLMETFEKEMNESLDEYEAIHHGQETN